MKSKLQSDMLERYLTELIVINASRCVDNRRLAKLNYEVLPEFVVGPDEYSGPQLLGGAYSPFDLALELAPEDQEFDFDLIYSLVKGAFDDAGYVMGIHMDTHYDEIDPEELKEKLERVAEGDEDVELPGCGYDALVKSEDNQLGLSERTRELYKKHPSRAAMFIIRGARLSILGGNHGSKEEAQAIINKNNGKTFDTEMAVADGVSVYNSDDGAVEKILDALAKRAGEINNKWGEKIKEKGKKLYSEWYKVVGKALAGMEPVEVQM